ncbi:MAG: TIGR03085 family metal-binding protein, partial [Acidimicrobiales bacterium]
MHRVERGALCDLLLAIGPDASTLCEGWSTTDLAVHLVIRERNPFAASGIVLGGPFEKVLRRATDRMKLRPYSVLVSTLRSGPPLWLRPMDRAMNLAEFYVHHEDVRRASGDATARSETEMLALDDALWQLLGRTGRLLTRSLSPVGLDLRRPDGSVQKARPAHAGSPTAILSGRPSELVLY